MQKFYFIGCFSALVLLVMACASSTPLPAAYGPAIKIDAASLFAEYDKDDIAADQKYKGKQLEVTGTITAFGSDLFGNPTVLFSIDDKRMLGVLATFGKDKADAIAALSAGQKITILSVGDGMRIHVQVKYASVKADS